MMLAALTAFAQTSPTQPPPPLPDAGAGTAGGIVFLFVSVVIAGGFLLLYLRNRTPKPKAAPGPETTP
jgi:hypothetical protein